VNGFGFWSGRDVTLEFRSAAANTGVVFVRHDLQPSVSIPAVVRYRVESPRRTTLSHCGVQVEMVEHVLAALSGLQVDNCEIWTDAAEMPGLDGSSWPFVEALQSAGVVTQSVARRYLIVHEVTRVGDDQSWIEARPTRSPATSLQYRLDYGSEHAIGRETMGITLTPNRFVRELAPARTFITWDEAEWLRQQGLAQRVTPHEVLVFGEQGLIDGSLRFENECAAHKVLDMVGDLALAGCDLIGQFVAHRSGHRLNAALVQALLTEFQIIEGWKATA
jgi:UDP-3-O-[3-hydroxymyristoyl] N-acetylglucosamine deacetylase